MMATEIRGELSDGSAFVVERGDRMVTISRYVAGECVWGQVFSTHENDPTERIVASMKDDPSCYVRWWNVKGEA